MGRASSLGYATALASLAWIAPAIGQTTTTRCVTVGNVTDCKGKTADPPLDYAKILGTAGESVPDQRPRQTQPIAPPQVVPTDTQMLARGDMLNTGNGLLETCSATDYQRDAACFAYIRGITDGFSGAMALAEQPQRFCLPDGWTLEQSRDVVLKWLRANPAQRHYSAAVLVVVALNKAAPCGK